MQNIKSRGAKAVYSRCMRFLDFEENRFGCKEHSMGKQVDKKFTWVIKNFSALEPDKKIYSDQFIVGGCKWCLYVYPKGKNADWCLSLFLEVADYGLLPSGWRRHAHLRLSIINQISEKRSQVRVAQHWFDHKSVNWGFLDMLPFAKLHANNGGFLMNDEIKIVAEVDVLEVIKVNDDDVVSSESFNKTQQLNETVDVNGFQVLPSQVEFVRRMFERNPEFASKFCPKNRHLKSTYMNVLIGLIETLCESPQELSDDDLNEASVAVAYVASVGFKVDLLENKLNEVKAKKKIVETGKARLHQLEEELQTYNQKCVELKVVMEKENADVLAANIPLSFDDVV